MKFRLTLLLILFTYSVSLAQVYQEYLLSGWTFKAANSKYWLPAEVPGTVQNDLILNGRTQQEKLVGKWEYHTNFIVDEHILARDHIELLFQGLDTQADVFLNEQLVLQADNMFRSWEVPIKTILKKGLNNLEVIFDSPTDSFNPSLRKAAYHFEGVTDSLIVPIGISKPVILQSWNTYKLASAYIQQVSLGDKEAILNALIDVEGNPGTTLEIEIYNEITDRTYAKQRINLENREEQILVPFSIRNPKRWWPASLGKQDLYVIGVRVSSRKNEQALTKRIGLREVEVMSLNEDSLSFKINGKIVKLEGVNYRPAKLSVSQMHSDDYNRIVQQVVDDKLNAIHVLGSGIYENEYFYDLADTKGILIIQDFMFSNFKYPATAMFLENVRAEAVESIISFKQHPSVILWTAGFSSQNEPSNSEIIKVLKESLKNHDPSRPFIDHLSTRQWEK